MVEAARECFQELWYTRTRIADIVQRAGTAHGNFYRHFSGLDEIRLLALEPALLDLTEATARRFPATNEMDALVRVNVAFLQAYSRHRRLIRVMLEAAATSENEGFARLWLGLRGDFVARTRRWLERLHAEGRIGSQPTSGSWPKPWGA